MDYRDQTFSASHADWANRVIRSTYRREDLESHEFAAASAAMISAMRAVEGIGGVGCSDVVLASVARYFGADFLLRGCDPEMERHGPVGERVRWAQWDQEVEREQAAARAPPLANGLSKSWEGWPTAPHCPELILDSLDSVRDHIAAQFLREKGQ